MDIWEKQLRDDLDKKISDGVYQIGVSPMIALTGKGGYINYLVEIQRTIRKWKT